MRYILHPGPVVSKSDGQQHYIDAPQLARLYGVEYRKCGVVYDGEPSALDYRNEPGDVHLYPKYNGDYRLPDAAHSQKIEDTK